MLRKVTVLTTILVATSVSVLVSPTAPIAAASVTPASYSSGSTPAITKVSTTNALTPGGTKITISGRNLAGTTRVAFGSTAATIVSRSSTRVIIKSPALSAGKYRLYLTTSVATVRGSVITVRTYAQEVLRLTNAARSHSRKCGSSTYKATKSLAWNTKLAKAAVGHSTDMAKNNYFSHYSKSGVSPFARIKAQHYNYRNAGENIAAGFTSPQAVVKAWIASAGHCRNLMSSKYTQLGVGYATGGYYGTYWTQDFGRPA